MNKPLTDTQKDIIRAYFASDMSGTRAAKKVFLSSMTVYYHFKQIRLKTGLNPTNKDDLIKLLEVCNGQEA